MAANPFIVQQPAPGRIISGSPVSIDWQRKHELDLAETKQQQMQADYQGAIESRDPNKVAAFSVKYPQAAQAAQQAFGFANEQSEGLSTEAYSKVLGAKTEAEAADILESYVSKVAASGGKPNNMLSDIEGLRSDELDLNNIRMSVALTKPELWKNYSDFIGDDKEDLPSAVQETKWFNKQTPEVQETHLKIKRGIKPTLDEKLDYEKSKLSAKEDSAISTARKKTSQQRQQGYIDSGVSSADNLQAVNRSIALLDSIKTGGIDNALIRAKQAFGIESGDEAELSYELGKSVLKQLKPTFGAAFTVNEMLELKRMEAGLGKSVAGNRRILKNLERMIRRSANRGMRAADNLGEKFAANEIKMALEGGTPVEEAPQDRTDDDIYSEYGVN